MTQNRFSKHPKTTLAVIVVAILMIMVAGSEKYLAWKTRTTEREGIKRHIRLKEQEPLAMEYARPREKYLNESDGLVNKEYRLRIDEDGFIYPSRVHDNPDVKIVFLGGSTTECRFMEEQNRFPYMVGRLLENGHRRVNSYNSGVSGNNTLHLNDILLNKIIPMNPNVAVMMENMNDLSILLLEGDYWNRNPFRGPLVYETEETIPSHIKGILRGIKNLLIPNLYSRVTFLLRRSGEVDEFAHVRGKKILINQELLVKKFKANLQTFVNICRANGIVPVLMTQGNRLKENPDKVIKEHIASLERDYGITYAQFKNTFDAFNEVIRSVGAANKVVVVDLAKKVPQEKEYIYDYDHYNDNGSKLVAKIITDELLNNKILTR